jgi:transposase
MEELVAENQTLRAENNLLRQEVNLLRDKVSELESTMSERISDFVTEAVRQATALLVEELNKAHMEIARLKSIINKNSSNSSKPSSTNGFKNIPNSRERSGKGQGGQKGHPGHRLQLPEKMEELAKAGIIETRVEDHTNGGSEYVSRFTIDVEVKVVITEHRFSAGEEPPEGLYNEVSYGNGIKSLTVLLMNEGIVAHKRLSEIIKGLTHDIVKLSTGTLNRFQNDFANRLTESGELEGLRQDLLNVAVMNTDDTSLRVLERIVYPESDETDIPVAYECAEKKSFRATVRTHSNDRTTLYTVNPKKDKKGIERDGILPAYGGTLCHDHESKFYNYGNDNSACGSHFLRDLKGLRDLYNCPWAEKMRVFASGMNEYRNNDLALGALFCDLQKLSSFEAEYDNILELGRSELKKMKESEWGYAEFNAMLNRLTGFKHNYMLFMRDYKVPFTNNLAERDLRSEKTKEKVSGLFRSWDGIVAHSKIRSFISTAKKRGQDLFSVVTQVIQGNPVFST